jgi:hypothetical protein
MAGIISEGDPFIVPLKDYHALLRMLVARATLLDKWRAKRLPGYWLNKARRELLIHNAAEVLEIDTWNMNWKSKSQI